MRISTQAEAIDQTVLTPVVRQALKSTTVEVRNWTVHQLNESAHSPERRGLYRITGTGWDNGTEVTWSVFLKIDTPPSAAQLPSDVIYWKREFLAYQSGLL